MAKKPSCAGTIALEAGAALARGAMVLFRDPTSNGVSMRSLSRWGKRGVKLGPPFPLAQSKRTTGCLARDKSKQKDLQAQEQCHSRSTKVQRLRFACLKLSVASAKRNRGRRFQESRSIERTRLRAHREGHREEEPSRSLRRRFYFPSSTDVSRNRTRSREGGFGCGNSFQWRLFEISMLIESRACTCWDDGGLSHH